MMLQNLPFPLKSSLSHPPGVDPDLSLVGSVEDVLDFVGAVVGIITCALLARGSAVVPYTIRAQSKRTPLSKAK